MKLSKNDSKKIDKLMRAVAKSVDGFSFHITPDGELQFTDEKQTVTYDYAIASNHFWFQCDGVNATASIDGHDGNMFIGAYKSGHLIIRDSNGDLEYITNTTPASAQFYFYLFAKLPDGALVFAVNEKHGTHVIGTGFYKNWYIEHALRSMITELILNQNPDFGKTVTDTAAEDEVQYE